MYIENIKPRIVLFHFLISIAVNEDAAEVFPISRTNALLFKEVYLTPERKYFKKKNKNN